MKWGRSALHLSPGVLFKAGLLNGVVFLLAHSAAGEPLLTPVPRHIKWTEGALNLSSNCVIVAEGRAERQVARVLRDELWRLHRVRLKFSEANSAGRSQLVLGLSPSGSLSGDVEPGLRTLWETSSGQEESYLVQLSKNGAVLQARSPRGLFYAVQTVLQLVRKRGDGDQELPGVQILDYPQLPFRGIHLCVFPNTALESIRQAILLAARFKFNAVVIEFWSSLRSRSRPQTAYESGYSTEEILPLVELGRALHLEMIPMLNSWGHASGMRSRSEEHAVLDRYPQMADLYEEDGWSFCLANPEIYIELFARYRELLELFGNPRRFHIGLDEAWGHLGLQESSRCRGAGPEEAREILQKHLLKIHAFFADRGVQIMVWHDMFLQRHHPELGEVAPANSRPPYDTHLILNELPKDIIIDTWNYSSIDWPVPAYFQEKGFPVLVSPWKKKSNTVSLVNIAKERNLLGVLATTWDSLEVALPSLARAGVLAWTEPGFELKQIPFEHWLEAIRMYPLSALPDLERTR